MEPVVDQYGNVQEVTLDSTLKHGGLRLVEVHQGQAILTIHADRHGYVFYRDLCYGRVDGVAASPIHWKIWEKVSQLRAAGKLPTKPLDPEDLYHPEVIRRRGLSRDGFERVDMTAVIDEIRDQGVDDEDAREVARARGLVVPSDGEDKDLAALLAEAREARSGD